MKRNMRYQLVSTIMVTAAILASCDVKDPIYETAHPEKGTLTLTTDWSRIGDGLTAPASYTANVGSYSATLSGTGSLLDHLFAPATHRISVYNTPQHITILGTTATVASATGNVDGVGPFIQPTPDWLFTATGDVLVEADKHQTHTAVMQQQVGELTLTIAPTGGTTDRIESIEGYLTGAAASLDFSTATHTTPSNVALQFTKITSGPDAGKWAATVRLLGIADAHPMLNATIRFADNEPEPIPLTSDLTISLSEFNNQKYVPMSAGGNVVVTPTGAGFSATISEWTLEEKRDPIVAD